MITVSPMRRRHLPAVLAIESQVYPHPWSSRLFEDELDRRNRIYLVAREGPTVVGYAGLLMIADDGHVATVAVDPTRQGEGLATRLMAVLVERAIETGAAQLTLEVRMSNRRAQSLYGRFGFVPAGARKAYYSDNGEDALVMWAHEIRSDHHRHRLDEIERSFTPPTVLQGFEPSESGPSASRPAVDVRSHVRVAVPAGDPRPVGHPAGVGRPGSAAPAGGAPAVESR